MRIFEQSKTKDIRRLRAAGLSIAHAERLAQNRRSTNAPLIAASALGLALVGGITAVSLQFPSQTQVQMAQAAPAEAPAPAAAPAPEPAAVVTAAPEPAADLSLEAAVTAAIASTAEQPRLADAATAPVRDAIAPVPAETAPEPEPEPVQIVSATPDCVSELGGFLADMYVQFDISSTAIPASASSVLRQVSERISACESAYIMVAGHADSTGNDLTNMSLSWERADQTLERLVALGVDPAQIEAVGFGARAPVSQGAASEEAANRRVDFRVLRQREVNG